MTTSLPSIAGIAAAAASTVELRVATASDATELCAFATRLFTATFGHLYPPEHLSAFLAEVYTPDVMHKDIEDPDKYTVLLVSKADPQRLCGYGMVHDGSVRTGEDVSLAPHSVEIKRIYVDMPFHGSGAAHLLMTHVMEVVARKARKHVWLGVYEDNFKAQKFYRKFGFREVGEHVFMVGDTPDRDLLFELHQQEQEAAA